MTDRELMQQALDALIDAADSQNWEMQQNIDQHGEWYRRSVNLKQSTTNSQAAIEALRARLAQPEQREVEIEFKEWIHPQMGVVPVDPKTPLILKAVIREEA
jgi:hypothetical protein